MIDLESEVKVIKDYEGGKSVMVTAHQSGVSHCIRATIFSNKNKVTESVEGSASLKAVRLTKVQEEGLYQTWRIF